MDDYARITPTGGVLIDTAAWIAARSGGILADLTGQLHRWARHHQPGQPDQPEPVTTPAGVARGWPDLARTWCDHAGHRTPEPGLIVHDRTRLDTSVWILPATTATTTTTGYNGGGDDGSGGRRIAVIGSGDDPPAVHADATAHLTADAAADGWAWRDADTVTITCPGGHWWTWRSGRELLTSDGHPATLTGVFGPNLDAPFTNCQDCTAHQLGHHPNPCRCDGTPWIVCPVCGRRCQLGPPHP